MLGALAAAGRIAASVISRAAPAVRAIAGRVAPAISKVRAPVKAVRRKLASVGSKIVSTARNIVRKIKTSPRVKGIANKARSIVSKVASNPVVKTAAAALAVPTKKLKSVASRVASAAKTAARKVGGWVKNNKVAAAVTAGLGSLGAAFAVKHLSDKSKNQRNAPQPQDKADKTVVISDTAQSTGKASDAANLVNEADNTTDSVLAQIQQSLDSIAQGLAAIPAAIPAAVTGIPEAVAGVPEKIGEAVQGVTERVGGAIKPVLDTIMNLVPAFLMIVLVVGLFKFLIPMIRRIAV